MKENQITLHASDLDGYLTADDKENIRKIENMYSISLKSCEALERNSRDEEALSALIENSKKIGCELERITKENKRIHVYSFETPPEMHAECSRIIAKLRNPATMHEEFLYYVQRSYELMFTHTFLDRALMHKRSLVEKTPVTIPVQNYAVIEFHVKGPVLGDGIVGKPCITLTIARQNWEGYYMGGGDYMARYSTYTLGTLPYTITSDIEGFAAQSGAVTIENSWPGLPRPTDYKLGRQWYTDHGDPALFHTFMQGGATIYKWRNEAMEEWGRRWAWLK